MSWRVHRGSLCIVDITVYFAMKKAASVRAVEILNLLPLTFLSSFFYYTPASSSFTLRFIKESFCFARLELFHSFFNLLSLIKLLSSLALSAKWTLCGRRSVCMHVYTHTHTHTYSEKVTDWARAIMHLCTDLSDWLYSHKVPRCPWNNPRLVSQRVLNTAQEEYCSTDKVLVVCAAGFGSILSYLKAFEHRI